MNDAKNTNRLEADMKITDAKLSATNLIIVLGGWNYVITNRGTASAYSPAWVYRAVVNRIEG